jgi:hypothetical protein
MYGIRDYHLDQLTNGTANALDIYKQLVCHVGSFKDNTITASPEAYALYQGSLLASQHIVDTQPGVLREFLRTNKKRKYDEVSEMSNPDFENASNYSDQSINSTAKRAARTTARRITKEGANLCTGEYLTNTAMIGHSQLTGRYSKWKMHTKCTDKVTQYWNLFLKGRDKNDTFLGAASNFANVWQLAFLKIRVAKPYKIAALNELYLKFENEIYGSRLPDQVNTLIMGDRNFLTMTDIYHKTKKP